MPFPSTRLRRLRINPLVRAGLREAEVSARRLVAPFFVRPGQNIERPIQSMPGVSQFSVDRLVVHAQALLRRGVRMALLFGVPARKDARGSGAYAANGIVQQAVRALKKRAPGLLVITDLCFCEYMSH